MKYRTVINEAKHIREKSMVGRTRMNILRISTVGKVMEKLINNFTNK